MGATNDMSAAEVKRTVDELECNPLSDTVAAKAVMKGTRLGDKSAAGNHKESPFPRGTRRGVSGS